jgi:hypothetical protein
VSAFVLRFFDKINVVDLASIDEELGCASYQTLDMSYVYLLWLKYGLQVHVITMYDPDRMIQEGVSYLREYYHHMWAEEWDAYWTHERITARQLLRRQTELRLLSYSRFTAEKGQRNPELEDIDAALTNDMIVCISSIGSDDTDARMIVVYGFCAKGYSVYYPDYFDDGLRELSRHSLELLWLKSEGLAAIGL